ncbi:unnamed protein product [Nezara viridula]|uniref:Uncharacterized protein n=1 Tax=Nezara viridula TaxID=85310 RepID=A0A9P0H6U4_NEZVI|nr:unnamed protein product [Nezara viridula]
MDWYPREHVRKRGRPPKDWDKEMKKTCRGAARKKVALERKDWKRMGQEFNHFLHSRLVRNSVGTKSFAGSFNFD